MMGVQWAPIFCNSLKMHSRFRNVRDFAKGAQQATRYETVRALTVLLLII
jgi:hypothetical protein